MTSDKIGGAHVARARSERGISSVVIVTDAWHPQINGVVRSIDATTAQLNRQGIRTEIIHPGLFRTIPCPTYPEIRLSLTRRRHVRNRLIAAEADHIHIATEGPLGALGAAAARQIGRSYSTCYHTRFPEYLAARAPIPKAATYGVLRRFHNRGSACMVATDALREELSEHGFDRPRIWPRGVDADLFHPQRADGVYDGLPRPIWLTVSRVAVEKSLPQFLRLDLPGTKVVVGDGPALGALRGQFPDVHFTGAKTGVDLARHYTSADAFVFPSRTETFGLVILEALASGLPVAALPAPGPLDLLEPGVTGVMSEDLAEAAIAALSLSPEACRTAALRHSWAATTDRFLEIAQEVEAVKR
jgi:glycosyltransferase involved in cell wall biosynthesis